MKKYFYSLLLLVFSLQLIGQASDSLQLKLTIVNPDTIPEVGARVELVFLDKSLSEKVDEKGKVDFTLAQGASFGLRVFQYDTVFDFGQITLDSTKVYDVVNYGLTIQKIVVYEKTTKLDVHFASGVYTLSSSDNYVLDQLVDLLNEDNTMLIELAAHTDDVGDDASNQLLSQRRATSVKEYLISKGISEVRLTAKGYGEKQPIASNETPEGRAKNRRTEVRVIRR